MKPELIRKNKRLTHFTDFKQVIIINRLNKMPANKKPKEENTTLLEFLLS